MVFAVCPKVVPVDAGPHLPLPRGPDHYESVLRDKIVRLNRISNAFITCLRHKRLRPFRCGDPIVWMQILTGSSYFGLFGTVDILALVLRENVDTHRVVLDHTSRNELLP
jgi:hypothetical protein